MIFLDANAFYSYYGRGNLGMSSSPVDEGALNRFLDKKADKSLPTSVFIEIVTHFRENPKLLKNILEFCSEKRLPLYNNIPNYVISPNEMQYVHYLDESGLCAYAQKILKEKIDVESKFVSLFYEITRDLYAYYRLESEATLTETNKKSLLNYIGRIIFKENGEKLKEQIKKELSKGYGNHKEEQILKNFYIKELNEACVNIDIIISGAIACKDENSDIIKCLQNAYKNSIAKGMDGENGTMPCIVDTLSDDSAFLEIAKNKISEMLKKGHYSNTQRMYLRDIMFTSWFNRGQKLRKNDIFDMFYVGCADYKDSTPKDCVLYETFSYFV